MKKTLLILSLLFVAIPAYADDLSLKLTPAEADTIWKGLRKLPVEEVEGLMAKIRQQVAEQTMPKPESPISSGSSTTGVPGKK